MPTYEYACTKCGHEFEAFQSMKDQPLTHCPACRKRSVKRRIGGGAGLIFKGSGFYITDYRKPAAGAPAAEGKPAAANTESKAASSEPKPAAPAKT